MEDRVIGPFFLVEQTINGDKYCDMITEYVFLQMEEIEREKELMFSNKMAPLLIKATLCMRPWALAFQESGLTGLAQSLGHHKAPT